MGIVFEHTFISNSNQKSPEPNFNAISLLFRHFFLLSDFVDSAEKCLNVGQQYVTGYTHTKRSQQWHKNYNFNIFIFHNCICHFCSIRSLNRTVHRVLVGVANGERMLHAETSYLVFIVSFPFILRKMLLQKGLFFAKQNLATTTEKNAGKQKKNEKCISRMNCNFRFYFKYACLRLSDTAMGNG